MTSTRRHASTVLRSDPHFIAEMISLSNENKEDALGDQEHNELLLANEAVRSDPDAMLIVIEKSNGVAGGGLMQHISDELKANHAFMLEALKDNEWAKGLRHCSDEIKVMNRTWTRSR